MVHQSDVPWVQCTISPMFHQPLLPQPIRLPQPYGPSARHLPSSVFHQFNVPLVFCCISSVFHQPCVPSAQCSISPVFHQASVPSSQCLFSPVSAQSSVPPALCSISPLFPQPGVPSALCSLSPEVPQSDQTCCFSLMTSKLLHRVLTRTMMYDDLSDVQ